ncbi:MAG: pyridoxal phosphate-dependent aminotransferase [Deltaproteobacteria bacterium]|nr:MAG: pyridoxal phosphate-dependent aminotransferase [Deltaproteobacteria bacterium]
MIRYSKRLDWDLGENALARAIAARSDPYIDLSEANPTRAGLVPDLDLGVLANPRTLRYEPHPKGAFAAREAVAAYYGESRGAAVDPERIVLTASTSEAYALLFKLLCDPGDSVLVPEPSYPLFGYLTALESVRAVPYALRWDGEWHLDPETVLAAAGPTTRAIVIVSPGNPTGAYLKESELTGLSKACERLGCALICDEVFADYPRGPDPRRVSTTAGHEPQLTFTLSGLSKVCGLPQLKLGWCVASGPRDDVAGALSRLELVADSYLSVSTPVQLAAPSLLGLRQGFQRRVLDRIEGNLFALARARAPDAPWNILQGEAGWSAILAVPSARSEEEWALRLLDAGVLVQPGYFYDFPQGSYLVVSLLPPEREFARAAEILARTLG